jgi:hypothetical protein
MLQIIASFARRIATPHILAEVDNLTRQLSQAEHQAVSATVTQVVSDLFEVYVPSANAIREISYSSLGLTDCATMLASSDALVVTDDFRLSNVLSCLGRDVLNINHIRTFGWRME